jgi:hypothetical protein
VSGALLATIALAAVLFAGGFPHRVATAEILGRVGGAFVAGAVTLHLGLTLADRFDLAWSPGLLAALLLGGGLLARGLAGGEPRAGPRSIRRPGWGLVVGAVPVLAFGALAAVHLGHTPDFVFHWGTKAARWVAERGVDPALFSGDSGWRLNPGYPQLVPELMALPGLVAGRFVERAALLVAPAVAAITLLVWRRAAQASGSGGFELEAGTAIAGITLGGFGFVHGAAGGADGVIALALLAGVAALVLRDRPSAVPALSLAAALAAAAKSEGSTIAALLLGVDAALAGSRAGFRGAIARLLRTGMAPLAVIALWSTFEGRLYLPHRASLPDLARLGRVVEAIGESALRPEAGFQWVFLLALPGCLARRELRPAALVVAGQAVAMLAAYLLEPEDPGFLVVSTLPRIVSHLVPAVLLLAVFPAAPVASGGPAGARIPS